MILKCIMVSERSQAQKATHYMIELMWYSGKLKTIGMIKNRLVIASDWG